MASFRVKAFNTAHVDPQNFAPVPSLDGFVDIDSVQTVSNKTFVNCTIDNIDPSRLSMLLFRASILGQFTFGGQVAVCPGLLGYVSQALATT